MTNSEALNVIESVKKYAEGRLAVDDPSFWTDGVNALRAAHMALKKQVPQAAKRTADAYGCDRFCPICGEYIAGVAQYCSWCGQRLI